MESEVLISGIGGQGVQLIGRCLGLAAVDEGRYVLAFGSYGGAMRGGPTDMAVVIGDEKLQAPPVVDAARYAIVMHHQGWAGLEPKIRDGGTVVLDSSVFRGTCTRAQVRYVPIAASGIAGDLGNSRSGAMVALGAFTALTGIVGLDTLLATVRGVLPPYRQQHTELNLRAVQAGHDHIIRERAAALAGAAP